MPFPEEGFPPIFGLFFFVFIAIFVVVLVMAVVKFINNATSPILTAAARVVDKRTEVHTDRRTDSSGFTHTDFHTHYLVIFELSTAERKSFDLNEREYDLLLQGDYGNLSYQGDWYKGFVRTQQPSTRY